MSTRIETLGSGRRAPRSAWIVFLAMVLIAAMLGIGALIGSKSEPAAPTRTANEPVSALARETSARGLIKGGLQPRPYSPIVVDEPATVVKVQDGFVRMPGGEIRPTPGS
jgi:hypothetical protein